MKKEKLKAILSKGLGSVFVMGLCFLSTIQTSFAAHYKITDQLVKLFTNGKEDLLKFTGAAVAVVIIVCLLSIMFSKRDNVVVAAWDWLKRVVVCYVAIISITAVVAFIEEFKLVK